MNLNKLHISAMVVGPLLITAVGWGASWATTKGDVAALQTQHAETRARVEKVETKAAEHDTGIAVLQTKVDAVLQSLERLENKMGTK